jgi:acetyltransferase-like isoleucine patch superfamily enzyme
MKTWARKWVRLETNTLPWNRARIHWEFMRRGAFVRWPIHGNVLQALREKRLEVGPDVLIEPGNWIVAPGDARVRIGEGTFLNLSIFIAALQDIEIGPHCMIGNGSLITDGGHKYYDPHIPVPKQGFEVEGPVRIGDNCWIGLNTIITGGVTIGRRCIIGANSVITRDIPPFSVAAGVPAKVIRTIEYEDLPQVVNG